MVHISNRQKGFAVLEILLMLVIVGILGGTGYYVYHANKKANNTYNSAAKVSESAPKFSTHKSSVNASAATYLTIKEWGVRAKVVGISPLYEIKGDATGEWAYVSSTALVKAGPTCTLEGGFGGSITRAKGSDLLYSPNGATDGKTVGQGVAAGELTDYKKVGDYYYWYDHSQAACLGISNSQTIQSSTTKAFTAAISQLEPIPS